MSIGTITITGRAGEQGPMATFNLEVVGLGAYTTGGVNGLQAALQAKLNRDVTIVAIPSGRSGSSLCGEYDSVNDLLMVYDAGTGAEIANTTNLSGTFNIVAVTK